MSTFDPRHLFSYVVNACTQYDGHASTEENIFFLEESKRGPEKFYLKKSSVTRTVFRQRFLVIKGRYTCLLWQEDNIRMDLMESMSGEDRLKLGPSGPLF